MLLMLPLVLATIAFFDALHALMYIAMCFLFEHSVWIKYVINMFVSIGRCYMLGQPTT